jgi:shikimate dehydrogenase
MYFIGVTTGQSSIMTVFPVWSEILGLGARIEGYDAPIHADAASYRAIVRHIREDPLSIGALITTHKIDLLEASRDLFDRLDANALLCGEISCIAKADGELIGCALDPISSGLAWRTIVEPGYFGRTGAHVLCLGAGGTALALGVYLSRQPDPADRPQRMVVVNRSPGRLESLRRVLDSLGSSIEVEYVRDQDPARNDALMASLPAGSIVVNATGMGKDTPGSPTTDGGIFPEGGIAWDLNYRGELAFLHQAERQAATRGLRVHDGWGYFLRGWTHAISTLFQIDMTLERFAELDRAASPIRSPGRKLNG